MKTRQVLISILTLLSLWVQAQNWQLVWADEFNYSGAPGSKWNHVIWNPGQVNNELQAYTNRQENARVENGVLIIEARRDWYNGHEYSSARLNSSAGWTYGRFEARMKLPGGWGTWPAFWLYPDDETVYGWNNDTNYWWPNCGEIDIMEEVGYDQNTIHASVHSKNYYFKVGNQRTGSTYVGDATSAFHVYAAEWYPDRIDFFVDNNKYFTVWNDGSGWESWPFDHNFHIILNLAVGGDWGGAQGVDPNIWPRRMEVDYVRVFKQAPSTAPIGQTVWLRGSNGQYVSSENGQAAMICNRPAAQGWEYFTVIDAGNGKIALRGSNGQYVSSENGVAAMMCNRSSIGGWEAFDWVQNSNGTISLRGNNGQFVSSENGQSGMMCNRGSIGGWEQFVWGSGAGARMAGEELSQENALLLFPNPVIDGHVFVELTNSKGPLHITLSDLAGRLILQKTTPETSHELLLPQDMKKGIYMISVSDGIKEEVKRIVVR